MINQASLRRLDAKYVRVESDRGDLSIVHGNRVREVGLRVDRNFAMMKDRRFSHEYLHTAFSVELDRLIPPIRHPGSSDVNRFRGGFPTRINLGIWCERQATRAIEAIRLERMHRIAVPLSRLPEGDSFFRA